MGNNWIIKLSIGLFLIFDFGCKEKGKTDNMPKDIVIESVQKCFTNKEKENAIKSIFQLQRFQRSLHPEVEGRLPIRVVHTDFITKELEIYSNNTKVIIEDSVDITDKTVRIRIDSIDCRKKSFFFSINYPIEGAIIQGNVLKSSKNWIARKTHSGIID